MNTDIYLSRKLEKLVPKDLIQVAISETENTLGTWNANVFYVDRKKCWIITNSVTFYNVILQDIPSKEIKSLNGIFTHTLLHQLLQDGISIQLNLLQKIVGDVKLYPTNNDKRTIGVQNSMNYFYEYWKEQYGAYKNWDFRYLNGIVNKIPYKQLGWKQPKEKMKEVLYDIS